MLTKMKSIGLMKKSESFISFQKTGTGTRTIYRLKNKALENFIFQESKPNCPNNISSII